MSESAGQRFAALVLPLMPSAYNVARWLTGNRADAEDVVQEAYLRAWRHFAGYRGGDGRSWLLRIVRNCAHDLRADRPRPAADADPDEVAAGASADPAGIAQELARAMRLRTAIAALPSEQREALVLREFEGLSYREIAEAVAAPIGTVMSRLSRARDRLADVLREESR
jgi:RNA polymerase sigma-70 factor, ECF subfamily